MFKSKKIYPVCYRIYLNLRFDEHKRAKDYGCLWDSRQNKWYFYSDEYIRSGIKNNIDLYDDLRPHMIINNKIEFL